MQKEVHFYEYDANVISGWVVTERLIFSGEPIIRTTQMGCLCFAYKLFEDGYQVFIHEQDGSVYEIKLGDGNERTNRYLKISHNFFKLWVAGEFKKRKLGHEG